jgi:hypothetical protein
VAPQVALVTPDTDFTASLVPIGHPEFLAPNHSADHHRPTN